MRSIRTLALASAALGLILTACAGQSAGAPPVPSTASGAKSTTAPPQGGASRQPATSRLSGGLVSGPYAGEASTLNGAGATFPAVLYSRWFEEYHRLTGVKVNYQSIGSGGGIKSITDQTVDFAGSDAPMSDEQLETARGGEIYHIPSALGAVVATYHVPGLDAQLKFTPETLAGVFLGEITKWNDPKLVADNPELASANRDIIVIHRSDGSGTTAIWTDYLSTVSPAWEQRVGRGTSVKWPVGLGGKGNEGVAGEVKQNPYSIGYVELVYALQNQLGVGLVKNAAGTFVEPTLEGVTAAAAGAARNIRPDLRASIVNAPGEQSYPIAGFTWLLAYKNMADQAKGLALTRLLWWATHEAQQLNGDLGYAPVPAEIVARSEQMIREMAVDGQPVFPH